VDPAILQSHLLFPDHRILLKHLPLDLFRFEGIAAITGDGYYEEHVVETIKNIIINPATTCGMTPITRM